MFPPQTGLSYSAWVCVERWSDPRVDPHCVRLLTLVRNLHSARDEHLVCLTVVLSARDKAIIVSTQEIPLNLSESFLLTSCAFKLTFSAVEGILFVIILLIKKPDSF